MTGVTVAGDVAGFIAARLDEDEAAARLAARDGAEWELRPDDPYEEWPSSFGVAGTTFRFAVGDPEEGAHIALHDPGRVLRQVAAIRAILALHQAEDFYGEQRCTYTDDRDRWPCPEVQHIAAIWSDHADYRQEWSP